MTKPNYIILIDLDLEKTALKNCILKITEIRVARLFLTSIS